MEGIEESTKSISSKNGFIDHVFKFDDDTKCELLNITQYSLLSVIPVIGLNKTIQKIIPDVDEEKGSIEILAEIIGQIVVMFLGIFFIHRLITFVPTYSKMKYEDYSVPNIIIGFLIIVLSLQTKLGEKTNILLDRILDYIDGNSSIRPQQQQQGQGQQQQQQGQQGQHQGQGQQQPPVNLTVNPMLRANQGAQAGQQQSSPQFDDMYGQTNTPLVGANSPTNVHEEFAPMAANDALGGSFGSAF
tara:strand:- start:1761 stop:2495 length:735 start_codon:yes stop_codon:yes gene_type:complete